MIDIILSLLAGIFIVLGFDRLGREFMSLGKVLEVAALMGIFIGTISVASSLPIMPSPSTVTDAESLSNYFIQAFIQPIVFLGHLLLSWFFDAIFSMAGAFITYQVIINHEDRIIGVWNY